MSDLPVPVMDHPYWRVLFRPLGYNPDLIPSLSECAKIVEKSRVQLRGWDFPHLSNREGERLTGSNWVGSFASFLGNIEYWRLYQSGQFLHLSAVGEAARPEWHEKLKQATKSHLQHMKHIDWDKVPGFISIINMVYTVTEIFEFAARMCQAGVYKGTLDITVEMHGIQGFVLTTDWERAWWKYCAAGDDHLSKTWQISTESLIAGSAEHSMKAIVWLCECFGWIDPNVDALRKDQQTLLSGRL